VVWFLTAYAFGKPVVATSVGGLLTDRQKRAEMQRAIEEKSRTVLSWDTIAGETLELYERIVREFQ
jgi:glycosyltransferase involved in cell wall biosynthesis